MWLRVWLPQRGRGMERDVLQSLLQEGGREQAARRPLGAEHAVRPAAAWLWVRLPWLGKGVELSGLAHKVCFEEGEGRSKLAVLQHTLRLSWRTGAQRV